MDIVRNEIRDLKRIIAELKKTNAQKGYEIAQIDKAIEEERKALEDAIAQKEYELQKAYAKIAELKAELELTAYPL